jgi:hypothetical protein
VSALEFDARVLARHLVIALAEDFDLAEVADALTIGALPARTAVELRDHDCREGNRS